MKLSKKSLLLIVIVAVLAVGGLVWHLVAEHEEDQHRFHSVVSGKLYRARQPHNFGTEDLQRRKINTIVNLRTREEGEHEFDREQAMCDKLGVTMVNIPISAMLPSDEQIVEFLRIVQANPGATLVHCAQGRSRTGVMVAAYRVVFQNWTAQSAYDDILAHGDESDAENMAAKMDLLRRIERDRAEWIAKVNAPAATTQPVTAPAAAAMAAPAALPATLPTTISAPAN